MASLTTDECSICEGPLNTNGKVITTECQHVFHRTCAQNRLKNNNRTDCYICEKSSAIADALEHDESTGNTECKICENPVNESDDVLVTDCNHVFHRACAQQRLNKSKRTDCRVCDRPSAIGDALLRDILNIHKECKICENTLNKNDDILITDCQHPFHVTCAQNRVNTTKRTDCRKCNKPSAIGLALEQNQKSNSTENNTELRSAAPHSSLITGVDKLDTLPYTTTGQETASKHGGCWECVACSRPNELIKNRCQSCGEPRQSSNFASFQPTSRDERRTTTDTIRSHTDAQSPKDTRKQPFRTRTPSPLQNDAIVYITNLPLFGSDDSTLASSIRHRIEKLYQIVPIDVQCYSTLGVGFMRVRNDETKDRLIKTIENITLNSQDGPVMVLFTDTLEFVSYIVVCETAQSNDIDFPNPDDISRRWVQLFEGEKPCKCDVANILFPNIYRIVSTSFDQLNKVMSNPDFSVKSRCARVYLGADCSYLEDLPKSINAEQLRKAISKTIGQADILPTSLHIQFDQQMNNVCIIAADIARAWATKSFLYLGEKLITKKENLPCRLLIQQVPETFDTNTITRHEIFSSKATIFKRHKTNLILEISDKNIFDQCLRVGVLRLDGKTILSMQIYIGLKDPEDNEIDKNTWYGDEMLRYKPDIMQFIGDFEQSIFRYQWNSQIWIEQLKLTTSHSHAGSKQIVLRDGRSLSGDQVRHLLRMTVMLNTIAAIRNKKYRIADREFDLHLNPNLKTVVYTHESKLQRGGALPMTTTPCSQTSVKVVNDDCLIVYEREVKKGKKPVLLNMASATSPGGGYRKGDGAQEENLFRRSDYFRSLDIDLDHVTEVPSKRFHCTSNCDLDSHLKQDEIYPMDDYGAVYTSGLTVFRQSEETGYAYMENPLKDVCSIAMAAYRDPKLDGNMLANKYAVGMRKKIENIFAIAYHHNHNCLILSAFGCGAFRNPPDHVAKLFHSVIEQYAGFFESVIFAIIDDHNTGHHLNPKGNFSPFEEEFRNCVVKQKVPLNEGNTMFGPYRLLRDGLNVADVSICDLLPCQFGAKCNLMYDLNHAQQFSHPPLCAQAVSSRQCSLTNDNIHMFSFVHRNPCRDSVKCTKIDDKKHAQEFDHPSFCPAGGACQDTSENHEKAYRHLPLCSKSRSCMDLQRNIRDHCDAFRHCTPRCEHGYFCDKFHDTKHMSEYDHPFPRPCSWTPYNCKLHDMLTQTRASQTLPEQVQRHCLKYAHVCRYGRDCFDKTSLHREKSIHVPRVPCPLGIKCSKFMQEDHLNSFTHENIHDFRRWCKHDDKCRSRYERKHIAEFRHGMTFEDSGVIRYFNLNENINFVQNQKDNIERVTRYVKKENWKSLSSQSIPDEIVDWIRTVQPTHRCEKHIFESILLQGHVMSREYMKNLKSQKFVVNAVFQQTRIRQITMLEVEPYKKYAYELVNALVTEEYEKNKPVAEATTVYNQSDSMPRSQLIENRQAKLSVVVGSKDMEALRKKSIDLAQASIVLYSKPTGIGYTPDEALQTNRHVFSILGPHMGHYYGNIVLIFKREILHHPDANFSIQAATSYYSGNAFKWRPWLGNDPNTPQERVKLFHSSKLHASIPGYEYATAFELMAITSYILGKKDASKKNTMNIDLHSILQRWCSVDSHETIEAHLPQLIPLDYIDHIYMTHTMWDSLSDASHHTIQTVFHDRATITPHTTDAEYNQFIMKELTEKFGKRDFRSLPRPIEGAVITIPSTNFADHLLLPLTIPQAFEQYSIDHSKVSKNHHDTTYIYWQAMNGDMMLTLSKEQIDPADSKPNHRYLIGYVAKKPSSNDTDDHYYHEEASYLNFGSPIQHSMFVSKQKYAAQSRSFYVGCNTDDFMTFCLEIQPSTGTVTLSHAGPNSIYNHETISCKFNKVDLDLSKLEFIYVSAGAQTVPIRNLIICFEKRSDLHPKIDTNFKKGLPVRSTSVTDAKTDRNDNNSASTNKTDEQPTKPAGKLTQVKDAFIDKASQVKDRVVGFFSGNNDSSLSPCDGGINCLIQFSTDGAEHNEKYSHPCRFAELCRNPEPNLTHEPRLVSQCNLGRNCPQLCDPYHRAQFCHTGWPYFLIPCRDQAKCTDTSDKHRIKHSHGEEVLQTVETTIDNQHQQESNHDKREPCNWGLKCRDINDTKHCQTFFHPHATKPPSGHRITCRWGAKCHDHGNDHRTKFDHP